MAKFTTTSLQATNLPPDTVGDITLPLFYDQDLIILDTMFTYQTIPQFSDPEGDLPFKVKITSLPAQGALTYEGNLVDVDDEFYYTEINTKVLKFSPDSLIEEEHDVAFTFEVSDTGSEIFTGTGNFTIEVQSNYNRPPTEVGDGFAVIGYGEVKVFTVADFTTDTIPPYEDPENDPALSLRILTVPEKGSLMYNGVQVVENQTIDFIEIAAGALTQAGEIGDTSNYDMEFDFEIADSGSGIYVQ